MMKKIVDRKIDIRSGYTLFFQPPSRKKLQFQKDFGSSPLSGASVDLSGAGLCRQGRTVIVPGARAPVGSLQRSIGIEQQLRYLRFPFTSPMDLCDGEPHPAIAFTLPYLRSADLLTVETVCTSLQREVGSHNNLLWRNITIRYPLNNRIGDKSLVNLARKSQGFMESLTLIKCPWITSDSLKIVLSNNPNLTKLCVVCCPEITLADILDNLRTIKLGLKLLRVNGLSVNTPDDEANGILEELHLLVSPELSNHEKSFSPSRGRPIDIEKCVLCDKVMIVYEHSRRGVKEEEVSPPCGFCGDCSACRRAGLVCYKCVCDECCRGRYRTVPSRKIVSSTCSVVATSVTTMK